MIRLNLLPARPARFGFQPLHLIVVSGSILLVFVVLLVHLQFVQYTRGLERAWAEKQIALRQKQKELARRRQCLAEYTAIQAQMQQLRDIREAQGLPFRLLTAVGRQIGGARISLRFWELKPDGTLRVGGVAFDARTLAAYTHRLKQQKKIQDVMVLETAAHKVETFTFLHFVCRIFPVWPKSKNGVGRRP